MAIIFICLIFLEYHFMNRFLSSYNFRKCRLIYCQNIRFFYFKLDYDRGLDCIFNINSSLTINRGNRNIVFKDFEFCNHRMKLVQLKMNLIFHYWMTKLVLFIKKFIKNFPSYLLDKSRIHFGDCFIKYHRK